MRAVLLTGFGGFDKLEYREDVPVPMLAEGEVLVRVGACGVNNTDIWTREGAYGGSVDEAARSGFRGGEFQFPRIQGADIVGSVVAVGESVAKSRIGERVIVNPTLYEDEGEGPLYNAGLVGSERDGGFAEFAAVPAENAIAIQSDLCDADPVQRAKCYSSMSYLHSTIHPFFGVLWRPHRFSEETATHPAITATGRVRLREEFMALNARLEGSTWLLGDNKYLCDYFLFALARWSPAIADAERELPHVAAFVNRMAEDQAVARAIELEDIPLFRAGL